MVYGVTIDSTGKHVPDIIISNKYLESQYDTTNEWINEKIGADNRRIAYTHECTSDLALYAAKECLAGSSLREVDCLILSTTSPDYLYTPCASIVKKKLGFSKCYAFDVREGCSGSIHAIDNAIHLIRSGRCESVLVIAAEILSRYIDYNDRGMVPFFSDGAGAIILRKTELSKNQFNFSYLDADESVYGDLIVEVGGSSRPLSSVEFSEVDMYWKMNGKNIRNYAMGAIDRMMDQMIKKVPEYDPGKAYHIFHQANINIIMDAIRIYGIPLQNAHVSINKYGNVSSASIMIGLDEYLKDPECAGFEQIVMLAFGAGGNYGLVHINA